AQIIAPFDGLVTAVSIVEGGAGSANAITLAYVSQLHVDVLVDETEIANIAVGQSAELTLDAVQGITLTGTVARIDPVGTVSNGVVNYGVRVNLDATAAALKLDMTTNASIIGEKHENVLAVPTTAIRTARGNQGSSTAQTTQVVSSTQPMMSGSFVLVVKDGQPRPVQVTPGMTADDYTEITGDVQEGDLVLVSTSTSATSNTQDMGGPPDGGMGGPPPDGGAGGPPPF
ncbi:MAG: HlyD family efflux transporter periplasmic adaptor subunit, partial [Chloroflexi bacterium]|nr:HlyD family efflux transporter periplasmic adaptor subunit [Chloroflexota bacterium]